MSPGSVHKIKCSSTTFLCSTAGENGVSAETRKTTRTKRMRRDDAERDGMRPGSGRFAKVMGALGWRIPYCGCSKALAPPLGCQVPIRHPTGVRGGLEPIETTDPAGRWCRSTAQRHQEGQEEH